MKNSLSPIDSEASLIDPTRISDMSPTAAPAIASMITERRTLHPSVSSCSYGGLNRSRCVRREKNRPAT